MSLVSFSGMNTLANVPEDVTFSVVMEYYDEVQSSTNNITTEVTVSAGYYTIGELTSELSKLLYLPKDVDGYYSPIQCGLGGGPGTPVPGCKVKQFSNKVQFLQSQVMLTQVFDGTQNRYSYSTYSLQFRGRNAMYLLMRLGFISGNALFEQNSDYTESKTFIVAVVEEDSRTYDSSTNRTTVYYKIPEIFKNGSLAKGSFQMNTTQSLYIEIAYPNSLFRSPFNGLDTSNIIARVPINNAYGFNINYEPNNLLFMQAQNITITTLTVRIYDDYGFYVNFQGSPWQMDLYIQYAESENSTNQSAYAGTLNDRFMGMNTNSNLHPTANPYNKPDSRDLLFLNKRGRNA